MASGYVGLVAIVGLVLALDWVTKSAVASWLPLGASRSVVDGFFDLVHYRNTGMAFGLFASSEPWLREWVLPAAQIAIVVLVVAMFRSIGDEAPRSRIALALVLGGAAGNLSERLLSGFVTDFLDFYLASYHWPAFNVADSAITIGAGLLILDSVMMGRRPIREAASGA